MNFYQFIIDYGERLMGTILEFKLPKKLQESVLINDLVITSTINNVMLIINDALHGTDVEYRPQNRKLAAQVLKELANHIKNKDEHENVVLSNMASSAIVTRYPEMFHYKDRVSPT
jgi:hypothetical protein